MTKKKQSTEAAVRKIRRRTRRKFSPEEKICIVLEGFRGKSGRGSGGLLTIPGSHVPPDAKEPGCLQADQNERT